MSYHKERCCKCGKEWIVSALWKNKKGHYVCPKCAKSSNK